MDSVPEVSFVRALLESIRPWQWIKNLFVLAPLVFSGQLLQAQSAWAAVVATVSFCFASSSVYLLNDISDVSADRSHPSKRFRPIASGALPLWGAVMSLLVLLVAAVWLGSRLSEGFLVLVLLYFFVFLAYSGGLKRFAVLDVILIASGFVLRVVGGSVAVHAVPSHWLLLCTFLLALYLGFSKRRQELLLINGNPPRRWHYTVPFLDRVNDILVGAALISYACYTVAPDTMANFGTDALIYGMVFVVYGLLRYLAISAESAEGEDLAKLLLRDRPLQCTVVLWALFNVLVIYRTRLPYLSGL